jgi:hypothetical protein
MTNPSDKPGWKLVPAETFDALWMEMTSKASPDYLKCAGLVAEMKLVAVNVPACESDDTAREIQRVIDDVKFGRIDLRPIGEALTGGWSQDFPAEILRRAAAYKGGA